MVGMGASLANVVAVSAGIGPSYVLNRRWVWKRQGPHSAAREVVPFVSLSVAGLVLSTLAVAKVAEIGQAWSGPARTLALPIANIGAFGAVWVVQFLLLDLVLFRERRAIPHDTLRDTRTEASTSGARFLTTVTTIEQLPDPELPPPAASSVQLGPSPAPERSEHAGDAEPAGGGWPGGCQRPACWWARSCCSRGASARTATATRTTRPPSSR